jgi:hypothetical protein
LNESKVFGDADIQIDITLRAQAGRTQGTKGAELLAQAVSAYLSALEVRTREQLPQAWAMTQNSLGLALWAQAARTQGTKGAELLAQAVAAFHSCLEIYTSEAFPLDHKRAQEQFMECERLLTQTGIDFFYYYLRLPFFHHSGNFFWTQLIKQQQNEKGYDPTRIDPPINDQTYVLDNAFPYAGEVKHLGCYNANSADNPGKALNPSWYQYQETLSFRMYLIWQCDDVADTIPVSLGYISWEFDANVARGGMEHGVRLDHCKARLRRPSSRLIPSVTSKRLFLFGRR